MQLVDEIAALERLTIPELRVRYAGLFGDTTRVGNRTWLTRRIAWRLQALAEGDLSERARQRASELANDADLRLSPPPPKTRQLRAPNMPGREGHGPATTPATLQAHADVRLPLPGAILTRDYKGQRLEVTVLERGFALAGKVYRSLSAVAKAVTGSHCNGFQFFQLTRKENK